MVGIIRKLRNNREFTLAVVSAYGVLGLQVLTQLALVPLYLSTLGKDGFGVLMVAISTVTIIRLGVDWLNGRMVRALGEIHARTDAYAFARAHSDFRLIFLTYGLVTGGILAASGYFAPEVLVGGSARLAREDVFACFVLMAVYSLVMQLQLVEFAALAVRGRRVAINVLLALSIVVFVAAVVPVLLLGGGLVGVAACLLLGVLVAYAGAFILRLGQSRRAWSTATSPGHSAMARLRATVGENGWAYATYGVLQFLLQSDVLLVGLLGGAENAGHYVLFWKVAELIVMLILRLSETLMLDLIRMDVGGDRARLRRVFVEGLRIIGLLALAAGIGYALLGHWLVSLWVGADRAPESALAYALAGGSVFWLGISRFAMIFAFSLVALRPLIVIAACETAGRLLLTVILFRWFGVLAPVIAINVVLGAGAAIAYARLGWRLVSRPAT
ncbi:MAG: hypothetical protein RL477_1823 [Pseudomonadota bacterium]